LVAALILGLVFIWYAAQFCRELTVSRARQLFYASILYLPLLLALMVFDKLK
jgi:heme O synthase-like polyprenyltransferase